MNAEDLSGVAERASAEPKARVLVFRGYAGWGPDQLSGEIKQHNSWALASASVEEVLERVMHKKSSKAFWRRLWEDSTRADKIATEEELEAVRTAAEAEAASAASALEQELS